MGPTHSRHNRRQAVVFGAAVAGGVMALTSLAFACTPIVGMMTITSGSTTSPYSGTKSVTVGKGRDADMEFCSDNVATQAPGDGIVGGATGFKDSDPSLVNNGDVITIEVNPMICPDGSGLTLPELQAQADHIFNEVTTKPDPRDWDLTGLSTANFLMPDALAEVNYARDTFAVSGGTYSYTDGVTGNDCMTAGINSTVNAGTMVIGPGTGVHTMQIPDTWLGTPPSDSGGVCVYSELPKNPGSGQAISMAPLVVLI